MDFGPAKLCSMSFTLRCCPELIENSVWDQEQIVKATRHDALHYRLSLQELLQHSVSQETFELLKPTSASSVL